MFIYVSSWFANNSYSKLLHVDSFFLHKILYSNSFYLDRVFVSLFTFYPEARNNCILLTNSTLYVLVGRQVFFTTTVI